MDETASVTSLLIFARVLYLGSAMMLVNAAVFRWLIIRPALPPSPDQRWLERFHRRTRRAFLVAAAPFTVAAVLWFWAVAAGMSGTSLSDSLDCATLSTVLLQTRFGLVSLVRIGLFALLAGSCLCSGQFPRATEIAKALAAAALLASVAWTGHAGSAGGSAFPWTLLADSIHLLAAAIWPTGLLFFAWILSGSLSHETPAPLLFVITIVRRFSAVSLAALLALAATGLVDTVFLIHAFSALVSTTYGRVLCLKIAVFLLMLALAAWNRFRLLPQLDQAMDEMAPDHAHRVLASLRRFVRLEFALAAGIVLIVAVLGTLPPPH